MTTGDKGAKQMSKHTAGPWAEFSTAQVMDKDENIIAVTSGNVWDTRLIAAAPELLEACQFALQEWNEPESAPEALDRLRKAIAKADGH